jgi:hypothetical protein
MKVLLAKTLLPHDTPSVIGSSRALTHPRFKVALAITVTVFIASCGSLSAHISSSGREATSHVPASASNKPAHHKAAGLSKRSIQPIIVETVKTEFFEDYSYIVRQGVSEGLPEGVSTTNAMIHEPVSPPPGVILANNEWIILTVAGNSSAPITINNMTVVKNCQKPFTNGTLFYSPSAGAGPPTTAPVYFNLDSVNPMGQYFAIPGSNFSSGGNFFAKEVVTLKYQQPQTFAVFVATYHQYCQFSFRLSIATVNGTVTQSIADGDGHPFAITADGEPPLTRESPAGFSTPFSSYPIVYVGGAADMQHGGKFIRVNPKTYHGSGDPANFALH